MINWDKSILIEVGTYRVVEDHRSSNEDEIITVGHIATAVACLFLVIATTPSL